MVVLFLLFTLRLQQLLEEIWEGSLSQFNVTAFLHPTFTLLHSAWKTELFKLSFFWLMSIIHNYTWYSDRKINSFIARENSGWHLECKYMLCCTEFKFSLKNEIHTSRECLDTITYIRHVHMLFTSCHLVSWSVGCWLNNSFFFILSNYDYWHLNVSF